jgi:hypothetical protein
MIGKFVYLKSELSLIYALHMLKCYGKDNGGSV